MTKRNRDSEQSVYEDNYRAGELHESNGSGAKVVRWLAVVFLFLAFVFMAFAASTPVTKKFYLFSVKIKVDALITKVTNDFRFGVWGYCTTGVKNSFGIGKAKINTSLSKGGCKDRKLGWTFKDIPGMSDDMQDAISAALTFAFVLHIIAAVTIFLALCATILSAAKRDAAVGDSEYRLKDSPKRLRRKVFLLVLVAFLFTMAVFIVDVAGVTLTKNTVHKKSKGVATLDFGPAFWFVVVSFGLVLVSFLIAIFDLSGGPSQHVDDDTSQAARSSSSRYSQSESRRDEMDDEGYDTVNLESPQREKPPRRRYR